MCRGPWSWSTCGKLDDTSQDVSNRTSDRVGHGPCGGYSLWMSDPKRMKINGLKRNLPLFDRQARSGNLRGLSEATYLNVFKSL